MSVIVSVRSVCAVRCKKIQPNFAHSSVADMTVGERFRICVCGLLVVFLAAVEGYREADLERPELTEEPAFFQPYERGFVGRKDDPDNPRRFRVNEGNSFTATQPNIFDGVHPRRA